MLELDPQHHAGLQLNLYVILGHFLDGRRHRGLAQHDAHALLDFQGSGIHFHQRRIGDRCSLGSRGGLGLVGAGSVSLARRVATRLLGLVFLLLGVGATTGKDTLLALFEGLLGVLDVLFGQQSRSSNVS